jgi:N-glycosylase/DNA lyase
MKKNTNGCGKDDHLEAILSIHRSIRGEIENRLLEFAEIWNRGSEPDIFIELVFCILTPQSKARSCWKAVGILNEKDLIFKGSAAQISRLINIVRFRNNKAKYIVYARETFSDDGKMRVRDRLDLNNDIMAVREWLVKNVKGIGYKEASHFLRNIGFGENIAILDRHILKNLLLLKVIDRIPGSITPKKYIEIEDSMRDFAKRTGIPLSHLDFVLWYREAGEVLK